MVTIYDIIFFLFTFIAMPKFILRLKQAEDAKVLLRERMGRFDKDKKEKFSKRKTLWIHAVSVGEVIAAEPWIELFLKKYPDWQIAFSATTPTGYSVAKKNVSERLIIFYAPFDFSFVARKVIREINPKLILLMETEIWPNLISEASRASVPVGILNGRISPRAFKRYRWIRLLMKHLLSKLSFCLVQSEKDEAHFSELGMSKEKISLTGNMKFDRVVSPGVTQKEDFLSLFLEDSLILLGGSTHWNEEDILMRAFSKLRQEFKNLKLILAPRHPEKVPVVVEALKQNGFSFGLYSERNTNQAKKVLVIDQMGVLASLYEVATAVFMGGSLVRHGGQNPIEAAQFHKAVVHGPNVFNFESVYDELDQAEAAYLVRTEEELYEKLKWFLSQFSVRESAGKKAYDVIESLRGATERNMALVSRWIESGGTKTQLRETVEAL